METTIQHLTATKILAKLSNDKLAVAKGFTIIDNINNINTQPTTRLDMAVFGLCTEGSGTVCIDSKEYRFQQNSYIILLPQQTFSVTQIVEQSQGIFICISEELYTSMLNHMHDMLPLFFFIKENPCRILCEKDAEWITKYHKQIFEELKTPNHFRRQTAMALMLALTYKICNIYGDELIAKQPTKNRQQEIFTTFIDKLQHNFRQHREVSWYAEQLYITPKYLSTTIKLVSGRGANDWIQEYVIDEAKLQLHTTHKTIQQIALELNFPSQSFFGKFFKQHTGLSPQAYRQNRIAQPTDESNK